MGAHQEPLDDAAAGQAALHALDSLSTDEAAAYEEHLAACPTCRSEVDGLRKVTASLAEAVPTVMPPPQLKERLMAASRPGLIVRAAPDEWLEAGVQGVTYRRLHLDTAGERQTLLVRFAPGTSFPVHSHHGVEECYVLRGDLREPGLVMEAGDYSRFDGGSTHGPLSTETGCELLIISSVHDEVDANAAPA